MNKTLDLDGYEHLLPGPWHRVPVFCRVCFAPAVVHSVTHAYVACAACGWQRRLITPRDRIVACLRGAQCDIVGWAGLLNALVARDPDPLPPCPGLLWEPVGRNEWAGPSATEPDVVWTVRYDTLGVPHCTCPNGGKSCWHRLLVDALRRRQPERYFVWIGAGPGARYHAAVDELWGAA